MTEMVLIGTRESLFNQSIRAEIDEWVSHYPPGQSRSAVIPALHVLQDANGGWLNNAIMDALAQYLQLPAISIYEVATFYGMFELSPVGKHKINICTNISCMLCGADELVEYLEKRLNIKAGETTEDGRFTLKKVECLGACIGAPMMLMDKQYHEYLTPEKLDELLDGLR